MKVRPIPAYAATLLILAGGAVGVREYFRYPEMNFNHKAAPQKAPEPKKEIDSGVKIVETDIEKYHADTARLAIAAIKEYKSILKEVNAVLIPDVADVATMSIEEIQKLSANVIQIDSEHPDAEALLKMQGNVLRIELDPQVGSGIKERCGALSTKFLDLQARLYAEYKMQPPLPAPSLPNKDFDRKIVPQGKGSMQVENSLSDFTLRL